MSEKNKETGVPSLVAEGAVFEGKIRTEGSITIDGKLAGDVIAKGNARIGSDGTLEGNMTARNVSVGGKVQGTVTANEKLFLEAKSIVKGDIRAMRLVVDEGAMFDGKCAMTGQASGSDSTIRK